jgi:endothelin-converting enzyme/putative endopeptidase
MRHLAFLLPVLLHAQVANLDAVPDLNNLDYSAIDTTCKPCDDFYQYSIGKWNASHPIPANQVRWGKRWAGADGNLDVLKTVLEDPKLRTAEAGSGPRLIGDFYGACMDTQAVDREGAKPLEARLKRIAGLADPRAFIPELAVLHREGVDAGFGFGPSQDPDNPAQMIATLVPGSLGLPDRDYYLKEDEKSKETRARYLAHVERLMQLAGFPPAQAKGDALTVLRLETVMARERLSRVERRDPYKTNTRVEASKLNTVTPHFDWAPYFRAMDVALGGMVRVIDAKAAKEFDRELSEWTVEEWKTLLAWDVVRTSARDLSSPFRAEMFEFEDKYLGGRAEAPPRWKECADRTDVLLGEALGKAYVEKVFPPEAKAKIQDLVKNVLAALKDSIENLEWMSPETKQKALQKLANIRPKVGYPDHWETYAGLEISRRDYFGNVERAVAFEEKDSRGQIGKPVDRSRWGMTAPTSNAYYSPSLNEIVFPAGILVPPMFSASADDAANYGGIGVVIGHEISHGFDDQGSQYDFEGRLKNWWTEEDRKKFEERAACVVDQFEHYYIEPGTGHNGKLVLGESIGDLAGARIAYLAYMKSLEGKPREIVNGFTPEQRFFLAWGQARGDETRLEQQRLMITTDPHPVAKFRVIGPLSNMPEFGKAFGCKETDAMVRGQRSCRIW